MIGLTPAAIHKRVVAGIADQPSANVTIKTDVPPPAFNYLLEHRQDFPGVVVEKKYLRDYPFKTLGAQLFGTLREISPDEIEHDEYRGVAAGDADRQGRASRRATTSYLRGTDGFTRVIVNASGNRDDTRRTTRTQPIQGRQLRLSLDLGLQRAAQNAVAQAIDAAHGNGNPADAGAFVAIDPYDGEVYALGSYPSFDANLFAKPIDQKTYEALNSEDNGAPLFNRAISAGYPTGSTFKPITAFAAVDSGIITPDHRAPGRRRVRVRRPRVQERRRRRVRQPRAGPRDPGLLRRVLLPARRPGERARPGDPGVGAQARLRQADRASTSPASTAASCPTASGATASTRSTQVREEGQDPRGHHGGALRVRRHRAPLERRRQRQPLGRPGRPAGHAAAAGHRLRRDRQRRPRGARRTSASRSRTARAASSRRSASPPSAASTSTRPRSARSARACAAAAGDPGGTSADVFAGFPYTVYGKTGTAERAPNPDQSWYAALRRRPDQADRRRGHRREGRLRRRGRRPRRPPDPVEVVRGQGHQLPRGLERDTMSPLRYARRAA